MRTFRDLPSEDGLSPGLGAWYAALEELRVGTVLLLHNLSPDQLAWSPGRGLNTIGSLVTHIAEAEAFWILEQIGGRPLSPERRELYRMDLFGEPQAPQAPRAPASYFIGLLADLRAETREVLAAMTDLDLEGKRVWTPPDRPEDREVFTVRWILNHVLVHEAHHKGQIAILRKILGAPPPPTLMERRQD